MMNSEPPVMEAWSLNYWAAGEVPIFFFLTYLLFKSFYFY